MCSSSEKVTLSDSEISDCLKKHGELIDVTEPCIFMPDTRVSGYEYRENEPNNFSLPFGINENDNADVSNYGIQACIEQAQKEWGPSAKLEAAKLWVEKKIAKEK